MRDFSNGACVRGARWRISNLRTKVQRVGPEHMDWLQKGEKYALIAMDVHSTPGIRVELPGVDVQILSDLGVQMPDHWREWLGTMRAEEMEGCNLFILAKSDHSPPGVLDGENDELMRKVWNTYIGLLVELPFAPAHAPIRLSGGMDRDEVDIRQQADIDIPIRGLVSGHPRIEATHLRSALTMGQALSSLRDPLRTGRSWRLIRTLTIFVDACTTSMMLDRIHQFCRCIEGLILPAEGRTKRDFKVRTELFVGPSHHDLIGEIYDVRSAVEHLHDDKYLHGFDRARMLRLVEHEAILASLCRACLRRILSNPSILPHFANESALGAFWALSHQERQGIWGSPVDPRQALAGFQPAYVSDAMLGADE